jgi:anti-anti-sigma factor
VLRQEASEIVQDSHPALSGPYVVVAPEEIDVATAPVLTCLLSQALHTHEQVNLDCADVQFCDSSALQVLIDGRDAAQRLDVHFQVVHPPQGLTRIAAVLRMSHLLETPARRARSTGGTAHA